MKFIIITALGLVLVSAPAFAQEAEEASSVAKPTLDCEQAITVFQDVSGMGRKDRAAKNMTKRHAEMAIDGWRLSDMEVYTENGDLEGFFLSYTRAVACQKQAED